MAPFQPAVMVVNPESTVGSHMSTPQRSRHVEAFFGRRQEPPAPVSTEFTVEDLEDQAEKLNPIVGYWDPLTLSKQEFWGQSNEATIGFLRHAEIKHGRVAMAGFVGYCVHENHIQFPWKLIGGMDNSAFDGLSAPDLWDKIGLVAQLQIIAAIGIFEFWSEKSDVLEAQGEAHYMRGGKPGYFPALKFLPNLYDPFSLNAEKDDEWKSERLLMEVNNGRLAMLGLFAFISEARVPGSVPVLTGKILPSAGEVMAPFQPAVMAVNAEFTVDDLEDLSNQLNPVVGYFDPLGLSEMEFWEDSNEATIGFLRHAEIKHGRVAMAGFVGYIVHENGIRWPWALQGGMPDYSSFQGLSAPDVWEKIPIEAKFQIIG